MRKIHFFFFLLFSSLIWVSCTKDEQAEVNLVSDDATSQEFTQKELEIPLELRDGSLTTSAFRDQQLLRCLKLLELDNAQQRRVRTLIQENQLCKRNATSTSQTEMQKLREATIERRTILVKLLESGEITQERFDQYMRDLSQIFESQVKTIRERLQQSLDACNARMMDRISTILTERQLERLKNCLSR